MIQIFLVHYRNTSPQIKVKVLTPNMLKIYRIVTDVLKYPCPTFINCDYPNRFLAAAAQKKLYGQQQRSMKKENRFETGFETLSSFLNP
jgi:hypothetical protein